MDAVRWGIKAALLVEGTDASAAAWTAAIAALGPEWVTPYAAARRAHMPPG